MTDRPPSKKAPARSRAGKPPQGVGAAPPIPPVATLRKRDLVTRAAETSGVGKKETKAVVEAVLAELGAALSRGEELALPPFGKAKVNRTKEKGGGEVLVLKLRRAGAGKSVARPDEALAEAAD